MRRVRIAGLNEEQTMHAMGIDDAYQVVRVLADGRGGTTELVTIEDAGPFVRKKIPQKLANRSVWAALADCACSRLPQVVATYELPDRFVAVYEYVPGSTLEQVIEAGGALPATEAVRLMHDVCEAVEALHDHGIIHRDIAPSNIVVAADGAHLIDLGIALMPGRDNDADEATLGTWGYASPEQHGFAATDVRSDVYSLGRVLGYLLTGVCPAEKGYASAIAADTVPEALRAVVERASAFEPSARYQSVPALVAALNDAANGEGIGSTPAGIRKRAALENGRDHVPSDAVKQSDGGVGDLSDAAAVPRRAGTRRAAVVALVLVVLIVIAGYIAVSRFMGGNTDSVTAGWQSSAGIPETNMRENGASSENGTSASDSGIAAPLLNDGDVAPLFDTADLQIVECGWWVGDMGYVNYGFALRNASADTRVDLPQVTITGRDASGSVVFTQEQVLFSLMPGETQYFGGVAGNGAAPAEMTFEAVPPQDHNVVASTGTPARFEARGVHAALDQLGGTIVTGEIALMEEGVDCFDGGMGQTAISLILRDAQGNIIFGDAIFVNAPAPGSSVPFEFNEYDIPEYAAIEVYAIPW